MLSLPRCTPGAKPDQRLLPLFLVPNSFGWDMPAAWANGATWPEEGLGLLAFGLRFSRLPLCSRLAMKTSWDFGRFRDIPAKQG
jgi:hypothetical protein